MSWMVSFCIRRYDRLSAVHISALMQWRTWRAFSRPSAKQLHTEAGLVRSNVRSSARV